LAAFVALSCGILTGAERGYLHVRVVDTQGTLLPEVKVDATGPSGEAVPSLQSPVPYGEYTLRAAQTFSDPVERKVKVYAPDTDVILALTMHFYGDGTSVGYSFSGTVHGVPAGVDAIVRVVSAFGSFAKECRLSPSGEFLADRLPSGSYVVLLLSPTTLHKSGFVESLGTVTVGPPYQDEAQVEFYFGPARGRRARPGR
jgi:hypothetical protein